MVEDVKLPEISENVESGVVVAVLVKLGDFVQKEQSLVELETEKATFELPSPLSGKVVEIGVKEDDEVKVDQVILKIDPDAQAAEPPKGTQQQKPETTETQQASPAHEKTAGVEAAEELPSRQQTPSRMQTKVAPAPPLKQDQPTEEKKQTASAAPTVRQLARELGVDINQVAGSGPSGRISAADVKSYARSIIGRGGQPAAVPMRKPLPDFSKWGQVERQPMTVTRRKIAETLSLSWSNIPHVIQHDQADITSLEQFRQEYAERVQQAGGKLTVTSILLKVVASALKTFPTFNASLDAERNEVILKKYYHVNVAVDTDHGLVVPVIRDVDTKSILELSVETASLAEKARDNKLTPEEMTGGTFTISNLGGIGGTAFTPIIYWPQVAILGVARARQQAVYVNGELLPRLVLPLSLSYDHRIIDGAEGVRFLRWIAQSLERPFLLAIEE
jgi:pyruvate dehydrogenase E2 component (dihydrolipoyllysine-residue acetyltransferase)